MVIEWNRFEDAIKKLIKNIKDSGYKPDVILSVGVSGFVPTVFISKALKLKNIQTITISSYENVRKHTQPVIVGDFTFDINNKNVLVVDDIVATGKTQELVYSALSKHGPNSIKFAVPIVSARVCKKFPDFYGEAVMRGENDFISFPWDKYEKEE